MTRSRLFAVLLAAAGCLAGCHATKDSPQFGAAGSYRPFVQQVEYPDARTPAPATDPSQLAPPPTLANYQQLESWPLSLSEAVQITLQNSEVIRDLGGRVLNINGQLATPTSYDPALQETNPQQGVEAALSQFDAQLGTSLFFEKTNDRFNQSFGGLFPASRASNLGTFNLGITKTAAAGTQLGVRNVTNFDRTQPFLPSNTFRDFYRTLFQVEARHPLLQGGGVEFNRIAGPSQTPGVYNGVLVARINNDITLAQFEAAVRDLCRDVERTYWQLHQAYRELDTRQRARHAAGLIWREEKLRLAAGQSRPDDEAQARQRYFGFQSQVETSLSGGGQTTGVFSAERQLRRLMGLPPADGRMIRPTTEPTLAEVAFDWNAAVTEALARRVELRQQRWLVRRRELELTAARNYRLPRLDLVSQYRWKGFGDDLLGNANAAPPLTPGSAFADLFGGDLQEWQLGLEMSTPVGNRLGHLAVRNAMLQLAREQAIQRDQELEASHQLAAALAEKERAHANMRSNYNSRQAALEQIRAIRARAGETERVFFLLDAQQRLADAESAVHRAVFDYNVALLDVEYRRGTLLSYMDVQLTEGPWTAEAHRSAAKQARGFRRKEGAAVCPDQTKVSSGAYPQQRPLDALPVPAEVADPAGLEPIGSGAPAGPAAPTPPQAPGPPTPPQAPGPGGESGGLHFPVDPSAAQSPAPQAPQVSHLIPASVSSDAAAQHAAGRAAGPQAAPAALAATPNAAAGLPVAGRPVAGPPVAGLPVAVPSVPLGTPPAMDPEAADVRVYLPATVGSAAPVAVSGGQQTGVPDGGPQAALPRSPQPPRARSPLPPRAGGGQWSPAVSRTNFTTAAPAAAVPPRSAGDPSLAVPAGQAPRASAARIPAHERAGATSVAPAAHAAPSAPAAPSLHRLPPPAARRPAAP